MSIDNRLNLSIKRALKLLCWTGLLWGFFFYVNVISKLTSATVSLCWGSVERHRDV